LVADVLIKETKPEFTGKGPQARNQDLWTTSHEARSTSPEDSWRGNSRGVTRVLCYPSKVLAENILGSIPNSHEMNIEMHWLNVPAGSKQ
jgi:hypothetical protein